MTLDEMQVARHTMEARIVALLIEFEMATGLEIHGISIRTVQAGKLGEPPGQIVTDVTVDIRL